jgi:hypothetical protein
MLKELIQSAGASRNGKPSKVASLVNASPAVNARRAQPASVAAPKVEEPTDAEIDSEEDSFGDEEHTALKARFIECLTAHAKATAPLSEVVAEMIGQDIERDEAIDWGIESGLSEGYVRSTVSSLYIALTGKRQVKAGGGRKANKGARACAIRALKECETVNDAKALLLAARRLIEKWEKAGSTEKELAKG